MEKIFTLRRSILLLILAALPLFPAWGQSRVDSLTDLLRRTMDPEKKAALWLERAVRYTRQDSSRAFTDIRLATHYYISKENATGLTKAYLARSDVWYVNKKPRRAIIADSLALALADSLGYQKGSALALANLGREKLLLGYIKEAETDLSRAIAIAEQIQPQDPKQLLKYYNRLGTAKGELGAYAESLSLLEKAIELGEAQADKSVLLRVYMNYANTLDRIAKFERATEMHLKAIRLAEALADTTGLIREYNNLAITYRHLREYDRALTNYDKSFQLSSLRSDFRSMGLSTVNKATVYVLKRQTDQVDTLYEQSLAYFTQAHDVYGQALAYHNYGNYLVIAKRYPEAQENLLKALVLRKKAGVQQAVASSLSVLGKLMMEQERWSEAEQYLLQAEQILEQGEKRSGPIRDLYSYLKRLYAAKKDFRTAFDYQAKELAVKENLFNESEKVNSIKEQAAYDLEKRDLLMAMEKENQRRRLGYILSIAGGLLLVLVLLLVILSLRRKQAKERHQAELLRLDQEHRLDLAASLKKNEQEERRKIANKLHDEAGALLSIAQLNVAGLQADVFVAGSDAEQRLATTRKLLADLSESVRNISHSLMPVALEKYGLKAALQDLIVTINSSGSIQVEEVLQGMDDTKDWSEELCLTIYRMVQEVLNNAIKHAQATHVLIQVMELEHSITVFIEDNGKGMPQQGADQADGVGLTWLKRNIEYLNGKVEINGQENKGTFVLAELPLL